MRIRGSGANGAISGPTRNAIVSCAGAGLCLGVELDHVLARPERRELELGLEGGAVGLQRDLGHRAAGAIEQSGGDRRGDASGRVGIDANQETIRPAELAIDRRRRERVRSDRLQFA